jgi:hypothetical protein
MLQEKDNVLCVLFLILSNYASHELKNTEKEIKIRIVSLFTFLLLLILVIYLIFISLKCQNSTVLYSQQTLLMHTLRLEGGRLHEL